MGHGPLIEDLDNDEEAVKPRVCQVLRRIGIPLPLELSS